MIKDQRAIRSRKRVSKIKESLQVVLSGEGSDEIFGGYLYFHNAPSDDEFQKVRFMLLCYFSCYAIAEQSPPAIFRIKCVSHVFFISFQTPGLISAADVEQ